MTAIEERYQISIKVGEIKIDYGIRSLVKLNDISLFSETYSIHAHIASIRVLIDTSEILTRGRAIESLILDECSAELLSRELSIKVPQLSLSNFTSLSRPGKISLDGAELENSSTRITGISMDILISPDAAEFSGNLGFSGATIDAALVADETIILESLLYSFTADTPGTAIRVDKGILQYGSLSADLSFPLISNDIIELDLRVPETKLQDILDSIPAAIIGELGNAEIHGSLEWDLFLELPFDSDKRMFWQSDPRFTDFYLESIPDELNIYKLRHAFQHQISDPVSGKIQSVNIPVMLSHQNEEQRMPAPASEDVWAAPVSARKSTTLLLDHANTNSDNPYIYTRMRDIAESLPLAVITAEDGEFFRHSGINWNAIRSAFIRNLNRSDVMFGGSTISMQLVKNVFLDHSRVLSRKVQELILVILMEEAAAIPKERQLEIYLNIAEFGPDIYGVHRAAAYYFDKQPSELSLIESVWLASILPSPRRYHYYYEIGGVTDGWFIRMEHILSIMLLRGRITEEEYEAAITERPQFTSINEQEKTGE
ncbi:hypothetical protein JCM12856_15200 [Spirochaeta dissipatitropha]